MEREMKFGVNDTRAITVSLVVALISASAASAVAQPVSAPAPRVANDRPTIVVTAQGDTTVQPDVATINAAITTTDDVAATASGNNQAIFDALRSRVAPLGVDGANIRSTFYNLNFVPRPTPAPSAGRGTPAPSYPGARFGYTVNRQITLTVSNIDNVGRVVDAAVAAGVTGVNGVTYGVKNRKAAYDAALAEAMRDAESQAQTLAAAAHLRVAAIRQIQVGPSFPINGFPAPAPGIRVVAVPQTVISPPSSVDVRASVTVTYSLMP